MKKYLLILIILLVPSICSAAWTLTPSNVLADTNELYGFSIDPATGGDVKGVTFN